MKNLLSKTVSQDVIFINNIDEINNIKGLSKKKLLIIKTDFKNIEKIKRVRNKYPKLEIWLAAKIISRKNILTASECGIQNVIEYPLKKEIIEEIYQSKKDEFENDELVNTDYEPFNDLKVLIVDDNEYNTELLKECLSNMGLIIERCHKPMKAAQILRHEKYDLLLLDIMMPDMSGFDLAEIVRCSGPNVDIPIVFISALSDNRYKIKSYNLGSYSYIEKPFNVRVVKSQVYNLLKIYEKRKKEQSDQNSYFSMVTHDMKGPVQAELSALKLLLNNSSDNLNDDQKEILNDLFSSTKYLNDLVVNVLKKYKCDYGTVILKMQPYSFKKLVYDCCDEMQYYASERNLTIKVSNKSDIDIIYFDYDEMKRVIHNLLANSMKYSYRGKDILINISGTDDSIILSIKNFGIGVNLENQKDVFEKFASFSEKYKSINTGLGLYISKKIIDAHGGNIKFYSVPEDYTEVTFSLPVKA